MFRLDSSELLILPWHIHLILKGKSKDKQKRGFSGGLWEDFLPMSTNANWTHTKPLYTSYRCLILVGVIIMEQKLDLKQKYRNIEEYPSQESPKVLPKQTKSLCPECAKIIDATIKEKDGMIIMEKICPEHGFYDDIIQRHAVYYKRIDGMNFADGVGFTNPQVTDATVCPRDCGLCNMHKSMACLTNIDLTNRCNLRCPICFANANAQGYVYELTMQQVEDIVKNLLSMKPNTCKVIQFSGGEPTIHPQFLDMVKRVKELGIIWVQIASNGVKLSNLDFVMKAKQAGVDAVYLQFDGVGDEAYLQTRGQKLWAIKEKAVDNCRKVGISVVLVPTIVNGINNHRVGEILEYGLKNRDVITAISYQPVALTGRYDENKRKEMRYTISDLAHDIKKQTWRAEPMKDWFPLSFTSPMSRLSAAMSGEPTLTVTCHSNCGTGTYLLVDRQGNTTTIPTFFDIEGFFTELDKLSKTIGKSKFKLLGKLKILRFAKKYFNAEKAPEGLSFLKFLKMMANIGKDDNKEKDPEWRLFLILNMHFQDRYNYNVERTKRCAIHYGAPNGKIYPFCTYNSGPIYREQVEKEFSVPAEEWKKQHGGQFVSEGFHKEDEYVGEGKKAIYEQVC